MVTESLGSATRLVDAVRDTSALCLDLARTRIALISMELQVELARAFASLLLLAGAVLCLVMAVFLAILFAVVVFWDTHRLLAIGISCLIAATSAASLAWGLRRRLIAAPRPFAGTLSELEADIAALRPRS